MSRRTRSQQKGSEIGQIEWLKHRTGFPSPDEREKIIRLRNQLGFELLSLATLKVSSDDPRYRELIRKYGKDELQRAERVFREGLDTPSRVADDARSYRQYRQRYARFGAGLTFYNAKEVEELYEKNAEKFAQTLSDENVNTSGDQEEMEKLLLLGWRDWEDITPPAVPGRPADYFAPQPASYPLPVAELLEWGNDLDRQHEFGDEKEYLQWKKSVPALTRMALDPGLLGGWPSENPSWAPWHAIHALGVLQAWQSAPAMAALADVENDWLSDHLPHIWADMGIEVEPSLWTILEDPSRSTKRRGLAGEGLFMMTDENDAMGHKVVKGFQKILQNAKTFDPTLNGYLIAFLQDMEALEDISPTIDEAFEQNRVDPDIMTLEDLQEDEFEDEDFEDDEVQD